MQAAFGAEPAVQAAAGMAGTGIGSYWTYSVGYDVERALTIPTLTRALNLLTSLISGLDLEQYSVQWTGEDYEEIDIPGETWMRNPSPGVTRQFFIGSIVGDLFWHGRAMAAITSRYQNGFPATFQWLPMGNVSTLDQVGPIWFGPSQQIEFNGQMLDPRNVVQFLSPTPGVLFTGSRMIDIAIRLDTAARRFATSEIAAGYLQLRPGGDPMDATDLADLASAWSTARQTNAVGALNEFVEWKEFAADPSKLQLTEGREYSALELSRVANVPPYLLGISTGGMTYQNAQEAVRQLWLLGARPIMTTIEETLSLDTILPRGRRVRFDTSDIIGAELDVEVDMAVDDERVVPERSPA